MSTVKFPKRLGDANHIADGDCLDCGDPVSTYSADGETLVVHSGDACDGFVHRFTPREGSSKGPNPSPACDERGNVIERSADVVVTKKPTSPDQRTVKPETLVGELPKPSTSSDTKLRG